MTNQPTTYEEKRDEIVSKSELREKLEQIVTRNGHSYMIPEIKEYVVDGLMVLVAERVQEARIEELKRLEKMDWYYELCGEYPGAVVDGVLSTRLAELEKGVNNEN